MSEKSREALHAKLRANIRARRQQQIADGTYVSPEDMDKARRARAQVEIEASKTPEARELREILELMFQYRARELREFAKSSGVITGFEEALCDHQFDCIRYVEYFSPPLRGRKNHLFGMFYDSWVKILSNQEAADKHTEVTSFFQDPVKSHRVFGEILERLKKLAEKVLGDHRTLPGVPEINDLGTFEVSSGKLYYGSLNWGKKGCTKLKAVSGQWRAFTTTVVGQFEHIPEFYYTSECMVVLEGFDIAGKSWKSREKPNFDKNFGFMCASGALEEDDEYNEDITNCWIDSHFGGTQHPNGKGVVATATLDKGRVKVIRDDSGRVCAVKIVFKQAKYQQWDLSKHWR